MWELARDSKRERTKGCNSIDRLNPQRYLYHYSKLPSAALLFRCLCLPSHSTFSPITALADDEEEDI